MGLRAMGRYENTPGSMGVAPETWPAAAEIPHALDRATLVMFAHPRCPCTRASLADLTRIMAQTHGQLSADVVFLKPETSGSDWDDTDVRRCAAQIPGVTVATDLAGMEARRFGAETSGHTLLFAADGRRLFVGGITASRGHEGANVGENAIVALVNHQAAARASARVFGCSLFKPGRAAQATACLTSEGK